MTEISSNDKQFHSGSLTAEAYQIMIQSFTKYKRERRRERAEERERTRILTFHGRPNNLSDEAKAMPRIELGF